MKFKEVIIVVLIMLIFAMAMLMYIVINDSIKVSSVPIISNNIENITCGNKNNDGDNANNKVNKIENLLINKEDSNSAEKNQKENIEMQNKETANEEKINEEQSNNNQTTNEEKNTEQQETEPDYNVVLGNYIDVNETVYATTNVNIRAFDNASCDKKGLLQRDKSITRTGIGNNGWSRVIFNGEVTYVASNYLTTEKPPEKIPVKVPIKNRNIDPLKPMVALTFDDGPNGTATPKILDILEKYNVVATFFDLGTCMENYPNITKREEQIGCEVGSHTYSHQNLNKLSGEEIQDDISNASRIYEKTLGHTLYLVRPPYGNANVTVRRTLKYPLIGWDVDSLDWKTRDKKKILEEVNKISNFDGKIILMHSIYNSTAEAVEELVPQLLAKGYQLVTVSEMAKYKEKTLQTSTVYYNFR